MSIKKLLGFTLIELMIALVINAILFVGLVDIFVNNLEHYRKTINTNQLNEQLQSAMNLMTSEIRRAGYWANAANDIGTNQNNNPYMAAGIDITVNAANNCVLFAYDRNSNGVLPAISTTYDDERYGYRLNGTTLQTRPPGASFSCTSNDWENMIDPSIISISTFTVTMTSTNLPINGHSIVVRSLDITLTGALVSNPSQTKTITQHVRVRNDKFVP